MCHSLIKNNSFPVKEMKTVKRKLDCYLLRVNTTSFAGPFPSRPLEWERERDGKERTLERGRVTHDYFSRALPAKLELGSFQRSGGKNVIDLGRWPFTVNDCAFRFSYIYSKGYLLGVKGGRIITGNFAT